jgi:hypothetical protein
MNKAKHRSVDVKQQSSVVNNLLKSHHTTEILLEVSLNTQDLINKQTVAIVIIRSHNLLSS